MVAGRPQDYLQSVEIWQRNFEKASEQLRSLLDGMDQIAGLSTRDYQKLVARFDDQRWRTEVATHIATLRDTHLDILYFPEGSVPFHLDVHFDTIKWAARSFYRASGHLGDMLRDDNLASAESALKLLAKGTSDLRRLS